MNQLTISPLIFGLALVRLLPIAIMLPAAFAQSPPRRWTVVLVFGLVVSLVPFCIDQVGREQLESLAAQANQPRAVLTLAIRETLLGLALGLGFTILLSALQVTGAVLGQMTGLRWSSATGVDPMPGETMTLQKYFGFLTLAIFVSSGGYRILIESILDSFSQVPTGSVPPEFDLARGLGDLLLDSFSVGIRSAAPVAFCLTISSLLIAVLVRSSPVLGALGVNVAANLLVMLVVSLASVGVVAATLQDHWVSGVSQVVDLMRGGLR